MSRLHAKEDSWIKTYTGHRFYPFAPRLEDIKIEGIAHSLAKQTRFTGHLEDIDFLYSVGQHSCHVHDLVKPPKAKFWALMHDAPETWIGDMASPIKWFFPDFVEMEDKIAEKVRERFAIPYDEEIEDAVKQVDNWICFEEARQGLRDPELDVWQARAIRPTTYANDSFVFPKWTMRRARDEFRKRFDALYQVGMAA
jgi:hypothetical protein